MLVQGQAGQDQEREDKEEQGWADPEGEFTAGQAQVRVVAGVFGSES